MRLSFYGIFTQILCLGMLYAAEGEAQKSKSLKEVYVELDTKEATLMEVFSQIESQTGFYFNYDKKSINKKQKVNLDNRHGSIEKLLVDIGSSAKLHFRRINNNISVYHASESFAQSKVVEEMLDVTISGKITDENGEGLPGASVVVKGTTNGTTSDLDGNYIIQLPEGTNLVFSFVGYKTQEVEVGGRSVIDLQMIVDAEQLEEIVVVGYGTQKKADITGSVASFNSVRLEQMPQVNMQQALQGAVPGLNITVNTNTASGTSNSINIRGRRSISGDASPLVVLDGVVFNGSISEININDMESIEVLKDASSSAIYGARGANGVIILTSKKGSFGGKPKISYNGYYGVDNTYSLPDMMDAETFYQRKVERFGEDQLTDTEREVWENGEAVNWVDLILRQGKKQEHNLSVSGGSEEIKYFISGNFQDVKGVAINDNFSKVNFRANLGINVTDWMEIGTNTLVGFGDRSGIAGNFDEAFWMNPLTKPFNEDGTISKLPWPDDTGFSNPMENILYDNSDKTNSLITNNYMLIQLPFVPGLSYKFNSGYTIRGTKAQTYRGRETRDGGEVGGYAIQQATDRKDWLIENIVNYNKTFGKHNIFVTALYSSQKIVDEGMTIEGQGFPNDVRGYYQFNDAEVLTADPSYSQRNYISQMLRINYNYNSKYLFTVTGRRDGFSVFGSNQKYGFFPSVALGWNIDQESFMQSSSLIDQLKLRVSFGENGNESVSPYSTLPVLSKRDYIDGNGNNLVGYYPGRLGNNSLGWETTTSLNVGVDFGLVQSKISGSLDVYTSSTTGLLLNKSIPSINGTTSILQNIGETKGSGIELALRTTNISRDGFEWNTQFAFTRSLNEIVHVGLTDSLGNYIDDVGSRWFIGKPVDVSFGYVNNGIWQLADTAGVNLHDYGVNLPGDVKYADLNGDNMINADDRQIIGKLQPSFTLGITNNITYKNFTLNCFVYWVNGIVKRNPLITTNDWLLRRKVYNVNYWSEDNPTNDFPENADRSTNPLSAGWYESASYVRLKDVTLSYKLPTSVLDKLSVSRLEFFVNAKNLITITDWRGIDPEASDQTNRPFSRTYLLGVRVGL
ncbi:TonB-dependent receptor [Reichenbachiella sp. MALMAid0571]|uniref:SusC/RagA family TonB-linked outer membrane protein n=1 Tax=Reichenbachiella sp. MALMAid0571 TaxID=3143939 RepID=UPI0032DF6494